MGIGCMVLAHILYTPVGPRCDQYHTGGFVFPKDVLAPTIGWVELGAQGSFKNMPVS